MATMMLEEQHRKELASRGYWSEAEIDAIILDVKKRLAAMEVPTPEPEPEPEPERTRLQEPASDHLGAKIFALIAIVAFFVWYDSLTPSPSQIRAERDPYSCIKGDHFDTACLKRVIEARQ